MIVTDAEGAYLYDEKGNRYFNFAESTNALGHKNPEILRIISQYLKDGFLHYPLTISLPDIAKKIVSQIGKVSGMSVGSGIFSSSGTEACDIALSIMSDFGPIITLEGGYQGNSGQFLRKKKTDLSLYGYNYEIPFPSTNQVLNQIEAAVKKGAKSIMLESLQVEGGLRKVYLEFLKDIRKNFPDLVIAIDECYTGFGKTGKFFSYQWFEGIPDILIMGKTIGGGLPLGLTIINQDVETRASITTNFRNGAYGSSAGNILALHLADFMISKISDEHFLSKIIKKGELFEKMLGPRLGTRVRGIGLVRGIGFDDESEALGFSEKLLENGIMATTMSDAVRLSPPLTIEEPNLIMAIEKISSLL